MNRNTLFSILATAALGLVMAGPVSAKITNWKSGDATNPERWHEDNNWSNGIPAAGDTVKIKPMTQPGNYQDPVLSTADGAAGTVTIGSNFSLTVTGRTLTLDGATQTFNGNLILSDSTAKVRFTSATVTVNGSSTAGIKGQHNLAELQINNSTLTSNALIHGRMTVKESAGTSTFKNGSTGIVRANVDGGRLTFASGLALTDDGSCSGAVWAAIGDTVNFTTQPVLKFEQSATGLTSKFFLDHCAWIELAADVDIATTNVLKDESGSSVAEGYIKVGSGGSFVYRDSCPSGTQNTIDATACERIGSECSACS